MDRGSFNRWYLIQRRILQPITLLYLRINVLEHVLCAQCITEIKTFMVSVFVKKMMKTFSDMYYDTIE